MAEARGRVGGNGGWEMGYRTGGSKDFSTVRKSVNFHGTRESVRESICEYCARRSGGGWGSGECAGRLEGNMLLFDDSRNEISLREERWKLVRGKIASRSNSRILDSCNSISLSLSFSLDSKSDTFGIKEWRKSVFDRSIHSLTIPQTVQSSYLFQIGPLCHSVRVGNLSPLLPNEDFTANRGRENREKKSKQRDFSVGIMSVWKRLLTK